jgi:L-malate glycosyltransferase
MKILIIPSWYGTKNGIESGTFVKEQAIALNRLGHQPAVIYADLDIRNLRSSVFFKRSIVEQEGIPTFLMVGYSLPKRTNLTIRLWSYIFQKLYQDYESKFGKPDIIHAHGFWGACVAMHLSKKIGVPYILTEHYSGIITGLSAIEKRIIRQTYQNASSLISVSNGLKDKMGLFTNHVIEVIPNTIDTDLFYPNPIKDNSGDIFRFIAVGSLIKRKNFDFLIRSFAIAHGVDSNIQLQIVGGGEEEGNLSKLIISLNLQDSVFLEGTKSKYAIAALLRTSDVFILSSVAETQGVVLLEAMACGLPVIVTDIECSKELVTDWNGILVKSGDEISMSKAIEQVVDLASGFDKVRIRAHAVAGYGFEAVGKRLERVMGYEL